MAGMAGLEPANEGVKVPCLTTWLHPCVRRQKEGPEPLLRPFSLMGWEMGLEPTTLGTTIRCSNQLSYTHHSRQISSKRGAGMVRLKGLEPPTHCLEGSCSIHLSYRRIWSG